MGCWRWKPSRKYARRRPWLAVRPSLLAGLLVPVGKLTGFLPYKLLDPSRLQQRRPDGSRIPPPPNGHQSLVGAPVRVKVTQVRRGGRPATRHPCRQPRHAAGAPSESGPASQPHLLLPAPPTCPALVPCALCAAWSR